MPAFRTGTVTAILADRPGLQRIEVDGRPAYVLTELIGPVAVGDRVVVNTTAVDLGLGSGGWDVVHWNLEVEEWSAPGTGHVMKLRYTSLQADTGVVEESASYAPPPHLGGAPVVACSVHSQLPCVAAVVKHLAPRARVAHVMTDGGALPLALSDLVAAMRDVGMLDVTVTAGQAFGGDLEAVNVPSALEVARVAGRADVIIAAPGPGIVGTGTPRGFSSLEVAGVLDSAALLGAVPVVALRWSDADPRERHRGLSHHSSTALRHTHAPVTVPVPAGQDLPDVAPHRVVAVDVPDVAELLRRSGLRVTTMGRGPEEEPRFFAYAGAAGAYAGRALEPRR